MKRPSLAYRTDSRGVVAFGRRFSAAGWRKRQAFNLAILTGGYDDARRLGDNKSGLRLKTRAGSVQFPRPQRPPGGSSRVALEDAGWRLLTPDERDKYRLPAGYVPRGRRITRANIEQVWFPKAELEKWVLAPAKVPISQTSTLRSWLWARALKTHGVTPSQFARWSAERQSIFRAEFEKRLERFARFRRRPTKSNSQSLKDAMVFFGMREDSWTFRVGETPDFGKSAPLAMTYTPR